MTLVASRSVCQTQPFCHFDKLPVEVIVHLFDFLKIHELRAGVLPVCKIFAQIGFPVLKKKEKELFQKQCIKERAKWVTLVASDGYELVVPTELCLCSSYLKTALQRITQEQQQRLSEQGPQSLEEGDLLEIPRIEVNVRGRVLEFCCKYLFYRKCYEHSPSDAEIPDLYSLYPPLDEDKLDILIAASELGI